MTPTTTYQATTPTTPYRAAAAALRALLPGLPEPSQQDVAAAALLLDLAENALDHAENDAYQRRMRGLIAEAASDVRPAGEIGWVTDATRVFLP